MQYSDVCYIEQELAQIFEMIIHIKGITRHRRGGGEVTCYAVLVSYTKVPSTELLPGCI